MKELFITFARYNREANQTIAALLKKLSPGDREKDRGSYYKSLSGLAAHIMGGEFYLLGMTKDAAAQNSGALKALEELGKLSVPQGPMDEAQWRRFEEDWAKADDAMVNFIAALREGDLQAPVAIEWYGGNPPSIPLYFMLSQILAHGTHHRGQISQILDELKIDNNYSGINVTFMSP
ncbi:MAG: DUF664 domain-containing protein [Treponema sp.]|jgi:uncharacterized damage-inducible protein DinB|nr:DUF664 domain-containing protein [Treponema sp.]